MKPDLKTVRRLQKDPVFHVEHVQGVTLEGYQKYLLRELEKNDRLAITACHGVGKTFTMARGVLWFTSSFARSKTITTAPTGRQVKILLWSEIRAGFQRSKYDLGGTMLQTEWKIDSDWFAMGFTSKREAGAEEQGSSFQGTHAPWILIVIDEAGGVPAQVWDQIMGMATSANIKIVAIGNPTSRSSRLYANCKSRLWKHIKLTCFDSPNLKANKVTNKTKLRKEYDKLMELGDDDLRARLQSYKIVRDHLVTLKWVMELAIEYGIDHPVFKSRALGEFPNEDDSTLIPLGVVEKAQMREISDKDNPEGMFIGVDVARFGTDKTVMTIIDGLRVMEPIRLTGKSNTQVVGRLVQIINENDIKAVSIDSTGLGSGVVDGLREKQEDGIISMDILINEVHFGEGFGKIRDEELRESLKKRYKNRKAKMFHELATDLKKELCLHGDSCYQKQLPVIRYELDSNEKIQIESKADFKKRTGLQSPDEADSLALANDARHSVEEDDTDVDLSLVSLTKTSDWR